MTVTLFDLAGEARSLHQRITDIAEGLFSDDAMEVAAATESLELLISAESDNRKALLDKADAWCWVIDELRAQAAARREHAVRLTELADDAARKADTMQDRLVGLLQRVDPDATSWSLPEHKLSSRRTTAVELDPDIAPEDLPAQFQRVKTTTQADKPAIKAALQAGLPVAGAQLVERRSWRIS